MGKYVDMDTEEALRNLAALSSEKMTLACRRALAVCGRLLRDETIKNIWIWKDDRGFVSPYRKKKKVRRKKNGEVIHPRYQGAGYSVNAESTEAKVHIMGDYILKWFERGTAERYRTYGKLYMFRRKAGGRWYWRRDYRARYMPGHGRYGGSLHTGRIEANWFFRKAREAKEREIEENMEQILAKSIRKVFESGQSGWWLVVSG